MGLIQTIKNLRIAAVVYAARVRPLRKNKVIFWADSFRHYGCSPKYIAEYLLREYPGKFELVLVLENGAEVPADLPEGIRVVRYFSLAYLRELHTAKFVICNMRTGNAYFWKKRAGQVYIQTWHSSLRLKRIEGDAADRLPLAYQRAAQADSARIDLLLSGCRFSTEIFRRAFWYNGEIMEGGTPRCDVLANGNKTLRNKVFAYYGIPQGAHLLLYAPTFRKDKKADTVGMDFAALQRALGGNWVIGCRLHPNIREALPADAACVDFSRYPDMQELLAAADVLVTDYSSCMFDMAVAGKPCLLFVPDLESYCRDERGLYFDMKELPFPQAKTNEELCERLTSFDKESYAAAVRDFLAEIGNYEDGQAAGRVAAYMIAKMEGRI